MFRYREYAAIGSKILAVALILLAAAGCRWMTPASSNGLSLSASERDSLEFYSNSHEQLKADNGRLTAELESRELDLAKSRAAFNQQVELNQYLKEELSATQNDLDRVERQFVSFEERLTRTETKASAVAAVAEVHLLFDKLQSDTPGGLDKETVRGVSGKLTTSEELIKKHNYAAAVYFADRAMRILNQAERRNNLGITDGKIRVVSVNVANLRDGPGSRYKVISKLSLGTVVTHVGAADKWAKVRTSTGQHGWIHNSLIR
jgi:exonuclease VII small subunit